MNDYLNLLLALAIVFVVVIAPLWFIEARDRRRRRRQVERQVERQVTRYTTRLDEPSAWLRDIGPRRRHGDQ